MGGGKFIPFNSFVIFGDAFLQSVERRKAKVEMFLVNPNNFIGKVVKIIAVKIFPSTCWIFAGICVALWHG
jgi:hypothetical protein